MEVTFEEARAHLGLETQRQRSDLAIARITPTILGLFLLVTLLAYQLTKDKPFPVRTLAWYVKKEPTFSDALAMIRRQIELISHDFGLLQDGGDTAAIPIMEFTRQESARFQAGCT